MKINGLKVTYRMNKQTYPLGKRVNKENRKTSKQVKLVSSEIIVSFFPVKKINQNSFKLKILLCKYNVCISLRSGKVRQRTFSETRVKSQRDRLYECKKTDTGRRKTAFPKMPISNS